MSTSRPDELRIFVAMPGTKMGSKASWTNIAEVRRWLLEPVASGVGERLARSTKLVIEKEKTEPGVIHNSMFAEAANAEIYIADLTGANPNVYLELGARWALRDNVTVLIAQSTEVEFNVSPSRVIPYGKGPEELNKSISDIIEACVAGLAAGRVDSPIRQASYIQISRLELDSLKSEVAKLRGGESRALLAASHSAVGPEKMRLLSQAVELSPNNFEVLLEVGVTYRELGEFDGAIDTLSTASVLAPNDSQVWRELGTAQSIAGRLEEAASSLRRSLEVDDRDGETWANLGGLQRRRARNAEPEPRFDHDLLGESLRCYRKSAELRPNETYALINVATIKLVLTAFGTGTVHEAIGDFESLVHLCRFECRTSPDDPWKRFDLAQSLAVVGLGDESLAEARAAVNLASTDRLSTMRRSALSPLKDLIEVQEIPTISMQAIKDLIKFYSEDPSAAS